MVERDDIDLRSVWRAALALPVLLLCAALLAWLAWRVWRPIGPNAAPALATAAPQLQSSPRADLQRYQADKQATLQRWGWSAGEPGVAQIPIDAAMQLLIARDAAQRERP